MRTLTAIILLISAFMVLKCNGDNEATFLNIRKDILKILEAKRRLEEEIYRVEFGELEDEPVLEANLRFYKDNGLLEPNSRKKYCLKGIPSPLDEIEQCLFLANKLDTDRSYTTGINLMKMELERIHPKMSTYTDECKGTMGTQVYDSTSMNMLTCVKGKVDGATAKMAKIMEREPVISEKKAMMRQADRCFKILRWKYDEILAKYNC